ncbi:1332_t:CDS:2 [Cetraspora pellucida]|uniref:1332_t:CDS:1 n=1 Tax=Cetraspora pellucida TaxID=1433469 RepID=A0A9N9GIY1_9GLOM|nr:1332_t:CDS:2 [Cetraspora pellucida]
MSKLTPKETIPILDNGPNTKERIMKLEPRWHLILEKGAPIIRTYLSSRIT